MNIYELPDLPLKAEITDILARGRGVRVERIISDGQTSGWYDQEQSELVILAAGKANIEFERRGVVCLSAGDSVLIKAHERHRVVYTSAEPPCVWICVFFFE